MENNELAHWGIKGQKWGIRRYQNKDGSLTAAGKKRRDKLEAELESLGGKKVSGKASASTSGKKSVSEMSDEELASAIRRSQMEKQYRDLNPEPVQKESKFSRFAKTTGNTVSSAAVEAGKNVLTEYLKKKGKELLGLNEKEAKSLKQMMEDSNAKRRILENEDWFENRKKKKEAKDDKSSDNKDKKDKKDEKDDPAETIEVEVLGKGTSRRTNTNDRTNTRDSSYYDPIDVDFKDVTTSSPQSQAVIEYGRSQVMGLLGPGIKDD